MTSVVEVLREARSLVDTPEKWCKGAIGYTADGTEIERAVDLDNGATCVCYCTFGAVRAAVRSEAAYDANDVLCAVLGREGQDALDWNNAPERTHADVLAAFDKAIALAEAEEASCTT